MTDPHEALAQVREALAAAVRPGEWRVSKHREGRDALIYDADDFEVARVCYPNRDANAQFIAACNPAAIRELLAEMERLKRAAEVYSAERNHARACYEQAVKILTGIHALLYLPRTSDNDGRTWEFRSPNVHEQMQELSDRIRALPDEIAAIDAARGIT